MRAKIIAGNWKMHKTAAEATELIASLIESRNGLDTDVQLIIAVPFVYIADAVKQLANQPNLAVSAQNCHWAGRGAFTGEISAEMLKSMDVEFVIIGHSERRHIFNEDDAMLAKKADRAIENGITPIFCCGELIGDREQNRHFEVIEEQLAKGLFHLKEDILSKCIIAYEPVWAIGTGRTATPEQAQEMHVFIRKLLAGKFSDQLAGKLPILYGGSIKPGNAKALFDMPDIDGGLIGGASLNSEDFTGIAHSI